jgi:protein-tyrosine phosphatase
MQKTKKLLNDEEFWKFRSQLQEVNVIPNLFISNYFAAIKKQNISDHKITHVVVCDPRLEAPFPKRCTYLRFPIYDNPSQNILNGLLDVFLWIDSALSDEKHRVLVHCAAGISRSGAVITGYLMYKKKVTFFEALSLARESRPIIDPNFGFQSQLIAFERANYDFQNVQELLDESKNSKSDNEKKPI